MSIKVDVKGLEKALKDIKNWSDERQKGVKSTIEDTANKIEKSQKDKVAVLSGETRDSITKEKEDDFSYKVGPKKPDGFKAHWIEFGTVHHGAQPFIRPSLEENRNKYVSDLQKELKKT